MTASLTLSPRATACGKVIVAGEHSVVYGYPALAAAIPSSLELTATRGPADEPVHLRIDAWDIDVALEPDTDHPVARAALEVFGYCDGPLRGWSIDGTTSLPSRAGLGSSAALTVALARLCLGQDAPLGAVVEASLAGERVFHGEPSGIDSEVAARGGLLRYVRGAEVEVIPLRHALSLVVVPSGKPRSTADQVAKVRTRHDRFPMVVRPVLDALGALVERSITAIEHNDLDHLGELFNIAHPLLASLDVSSWILDEMCDAARAAGARGAKLTGAGGGGCILCLPQDDPAPLFAALQARGHAPVRIDLEPSS
ncbi:MAG: mevalonate kinase [Nannocystaceae bacterium]|nr:mevalonate kinase [bacterium]